MDPKDIVRRGYDQVSRAYRGDAFAPSDPAQRQYLDWLDELLPLMPPGAVVLDLGCGNGVPVGVALAAAGCRYTGVDLSPVQIERARTIVADGTFICADIWTCKFEPGSFDAVVAFYSLIHVPLPEQPALLGTIRRWLRPGGLLMATVGATAWTGTEDSWLDVQGATMYWSHADAATYERWLGEQGFSVRWTRFVPEGQGGHTLVLAAAGT